MSSRNVVADSALMTVLGSLATGPRSVPEIPRAWPVTRTLIRSLVRRLMADGVVEPADAGSVRRVRLTALGLSTMAGLDTRTT